MSNKMTVLKNGLACIGFIKLIIDKVIIVIVRLISNLFACGVFCNIFDTLMFGKFLEYFKK